jgi:hypothetical protein
MTEKHHMNQKSIHIFIMTNTRVFTDNMTWRDDVAQVMGLVNPKWVQSAPHPWPAGHVLVHFQETFSPRVKVSR